MRMLLVAAMLLAMGTAAARAEPVRFKVMPPGADVIDLDAGGVRIATSDAAPEFECRFEADTSRTHHYAIRRHPYDDGALILSWNPDAHRWHDDVQNRLLGESDHADLSRTFFLNSVPADVQICEDALPGAVTSSVSTVDGQARLLRPLARRGRTVVVPSAWRPVRLYVLRSGFETGSYQFSDGELSNEGGVLPLEPIRLHPRYGPFSYWQFNAALVCLSAGLFLAWAMVLRPASRRRQVQEAEERQMTQQVLATARAVVPMQRIDALTLLSQHVRTESGYEFVLLEMLGKGGMGAVFRALRVGDQETWAVKVLLENRWDEEIFRQRFIREMSICSHLTHPGIVKVLDWGLLQPEDERSQPYPFLVMELLDGETLRACIARGIVPLEQATSWMLDALRALHATHQAGVIHRDIKPDNIMVLPSGHIKLMDFGIARQPGQTVTETAAVFGTPVYMSPEQLNGARGVTVQSDIYSLGAVYYELLAGQPPWPNVEGERELWGLVGRILHGQLMPLRSLAPDVPEAVEAVIHRMLDRDLSYRYASVLDVIEALSG